MGKCRMGVTARDRTRSGGRGGGVGLTIPESAKCKVCRRARRTRRCSTCGRYRETSRRSGGVTETPPRSSTRSGALVCARRARSALETPPLLLFPLLLLPVPQVSSSARPCTGRPGRRATAAPMGPRKARSSERALGGSDSGGAEGSVSARWRCKR